MNDIKLSTGEMFPRLGLGTWAIGGEFWDGDQPLGWGKVDDVESIQAIHRALDLGVRVFDTADIYGCGHAEEVLRRALKDTSERVFISTKFGHAFDAATKKRTGDGYDKAYVGMAIDASLKRLGREQIDLVFFHQNGFPLDKSEETFLALETAYKHGKIGGFGWSTDDVDGARAFAGLDGFCAIQHDMNLFRPATQMTALTQELGLTSFARQPLAMGLLTGKFEDKVSVLDPTDIRANTPDWLVYFKQGRPNPDLLKLIANVRELLMIDGRTVAQGALSWLLAMAPNVVPIPGFRTVKQVEDNVAVLEKGALPEDTIRQIDEIVSSASRVDLDQAKFSSE